MLSNDDKLRMIQDLKKCDTANQMFDHIVANYKVEDCKLSMITKPILIEGLIKAINLLNPKKR